MKKIILYLIFLSVIGLNFLKANINEENGWEFLKKALIDIPHERYTKYIKFGSGMVLLTFLSKLITKKEKFLSTFNDKLGFTIVGVLSGCFWLSRNKFLNILEKKELQNFIENWDENKKILQDLPEVGVEFNNLYAKYKESKKLITNELDKIHKSIKSKIEDHFKINN